MFMDHYQYTAQQWWLVWVPVTMDGPGTTIPIINTIGTDTIMDSRRLSAYHEPA